MEAALLCNGDGAHDLCLELTETALLDRSKNVDTTLGALLSNTPTCVPQFSRR